MQQGIFLEIVEEKDSQRTLEMVIEALSYHNPKWLIDNLDCHYETDLVEGKYSSNELLNLLKENSRVFEARMISVVEDEDLSMEIYTGEDFLNSNAESVVFVADLTFFSIFSKTESLLKLIEQEAKISQNATIERIEQGFGGCESFR